jgi:hypothetical protein
MARGEFLTNLRTAVGTFLSPHVQVDGIRLDDEQVARALRESTAWLTGQSVEGFQPQEFPELSEDERQALDASVRTIRRVIAQLPEDVPPPPEKVEEAIPAFLAVLRTLAPHLEWFRIYRILKKHEFPDYVRDFAVRVGEDWTGDPGAWVWVVIKDQYGGRDGIKAVLPLLTQVRSVLRRAGVDLYPYVVFRTESEQHELETTAVA